MKRYNTIRELTEGVKSGRKHYALLYRPVKPKKSLWSLLFGEKTKKANLYILPECRIDRAYESSGKVDIEYIDLDGYTYNRNISWTNIYIWE